MARADQPVFPTFAREANEAIWTAARTARAEGNTDAYEAWLSLARRSDDLVDGIAEAAQ